MSSDLRTTEEITTTPVPAESTAKNTVWYWLQLSCGIVSVILLIIFVIFGLLLLNAMIY